METIEQYIQSRMSGRIVRRGNSPLVGIVLLVAGGALIALAFATSLSSNAQTALLTVGFIAAAVGAVLAVLCMAGALWHYVDTQSGKAMRSRSLYLSASDFSRAVQAAEQAALPADLAPVTSSNLQLQAVVGQGLALVQVGHCDSSQFEPAAPVVQLEGQSIPAFLFK